MLAEIEITGGTNATARGTYLVRREAIASDVGSVEQGLTTGAERAFVITRHPPAELIRADCRVRDLSSLDGPLDFTIAQVEMMDTEVRLTCRETR